jgi:hypothetical protein
MKHHCWDPQQLPGTLTPSCKHLIILYRCCYGAASAWFSLSLLWNGCLWYRFKSDKPITYHIILQSVRASQIDLICIKTPLHPWLLWSYVSYCLPYFLPCEPVEHKLGKINPMKCQDWQHKSSSVPWWELFIFWIWISWHSNRLISAWLIHLPSEVARTLLFLSSLTMVLWSFRPLFVMGYRDMMAD